MSASQSIIFTTMCLFQLLHGSSPSSSIASFSISTNSSPTNNNPSINMRLHWDTYIYECNSTYTTIYNHSFQYLCITNNTNICNNSYYVSPKYSLSIWSSLNHPISIYSLTIHQTTSQCPHFLSNLYHNCTQYNPQIQPFTLINTSITINLIDTTSIQYTPISQTQWNDCPTIKISSIAIETYGDNGEPNDDVYITLFWGFQVLQCIINYTSTSQSQPFSCNHSQITLLYENTDKEYKTKLYYNHPFMLRINSIIITDLYSNEYIFTEFCGPIEFYYWDTDATSSKTLCDDYLYQKRYQYDYIELCTETAYLQMLYINFNDDILLSPYTNHSNYALSASVQPVDIVSFGIKTANSSLYIAPSFHWMELVLYWDTYIYHCDLYIDAIDRYFHCNDSMVTITQNTSNPSMFKIDIEYGTDIAIDEVYVLDRSGYKYTINTFCLSSQYTSIGIPTQSNTEQCIQFENNNLHKYDKIFISNYFYPHLTIEFSQLLFQEPNIYQEGYVDPIVVYTNTSLISFGLKLSYPLVNGTMNITLGLYWPPHNAWYTCALTMNTADMSYVCNISGSVMIESMQCEWLMMKITNLDNDQAVYIDELMFYGEHNTSLVIDIFYDNPYYVYYLYLGEGESKLLIPWWVLVNDTYEIIIAYTESIDDIECLSASYSTTEGIETTVVQDAIQSRMDLQTLLLIIVLVVVCFLCVAIGYIFYYIKIQHVQSTRSPTRKSSQNSKINSPRLPKNASFDSRVKYSKVHIQDDIKEDDRGNGIDIDIEGIALNVSVVVSKDSRSLSTCTQKEGYIKETNSYQNLEIIKCDDAIDHHSESYPERPSAHHLEMVHLCNDEDDDDDEKQSQFDQTENDNQSDQSNSDDMYEKPGDVVVETAS